MVEKLCEYGCSRIATHVLKNGKLCCEASSNKCPEIKRKNSEGLKKSHKKGREYKYNPKAHENRRNVTVLKYDDVFKKNSTTSKKTVKDIIIRDKLKEYECVKCKNIGKWMNEKIILELDHINGDKFDNRLKNLRFLCPNCHSQTPTFRGKNKNYDNKFNEKKIKESVKNSYSVNEVLRKCNIRESKSKRGEVFEIMYENNIKLLNKTKELKQPRQPKQKYFCPQCKEEYSGKGDICRKCYNEKNRKVKRPPYKQLLQEIKETSYVAVGKTYGVSDNTIRKWIKAYEK